MAPSIPARTDPGSPTPAVQRGVISKQVITFDAGQTLVELDLDFLAVRLEERGASVAPHALATAAPQAWQHYDRLVAEGVPHPWRQLFIALLRGAGIAEPSALVEWLWEQQPKRNLFRKPIAGMVELAREIAGRGAIVAVLSNSEGHVADLLAEVGIADAFVAIVDSGRVGFEKPDRRIFDHALAVVGARGADAIHIGDSWSADVAGALGAGWRAVWYGRVTDTDDPRVATARDPTEARAALVRWGVL